MICVKNFEMPQKTLWTLRPGEMYGDHQFLSGALTVTSQSLFSGIHGTVGCEAVILGMSHVSLVILDMSHVSLVPTQCIHICTRDMSHVTHTGNMGCEAVILEKSYVMTELLEDLAFAERFFRDMATAIVKRLNSELLLYYGMFVM
jgi:hypothetical protein